MSSISGTVTDPTGSPLPGTAIVVCNLENGAQRKLVSDDVGRYATLSLPVGTYEVIGVKEGFRSISRTGIALIAGQAAEVALELPLAQAGQASESTDERIRQLEQKVAELEKEAIANQTASPTNSNRHNAASTTADTTGFTIRSEDGNFVLHIGADLQIDNRTYVGAGSSADVDTIVPRRVRPTLYGTVYKYVDFFIRPDFGLGTTALYDAYVQLNYFSWAQIRAGKFKPPIGMERLQSDDDTNFVERGLPTLLVPQRDIGYQMGADLLHRRLSYQIGVFNGVPDSSIGTDTAVSNHRDYAARVFLTPFQPDEKNLLKGLGVGFAASGGNTDGEALPSFKTLGQVSFMTFNSGVIPEGHRTRLAPQAYYYLGPFGVLTEYGLNEEGFEKDDVRRNIAFRAYQAQVTYILTGESKSFASPTPKRAFDPVHHGGWGAVELAVRVADFEAENGIYTYGLVNPATSPRHLHEWTGGVNWYLNRLVRISADYGNTAFGGGAAVSAGGNRPAEKVIILRFQLNFT
jgi:phosphate-selective porin OprO/OprP